MHVVLSKIQTTNNASDKLDYYHFNEPDRTHPYVGFTHGVRCRGAGAPPPRIWNYESDFFRFRPPPPILESSGPHGFT